MIWTITIWTVEQELRCHGHSGTGPIDVTIALKPPTMRAFVQTSRRMFVVQFIESFS